MSFSNDRLRLTWWWEGKAEGYEILCCLSNRWNDAQLWQTSISDFHAGLQSLGYAVFLLVPGMPRQQTETPPEVVSTPISSLSLARPHNSNQKENFPVSNKARAIASGPADFTFVRFVSIVHSSYEKTWLACAATRPLRSAAGKLVKDPAHSGRAQYLEP